MHNSSTNSHWQSVPKELIKLVKEAKGTCSVIADLLPSFTNIFMKGIWYIPSKSKIAFSYTPYSDTDKIASVHCQLREIPEIEEVIHSAWYQPDPTEINIPIKNAELQNSDIFGPVASAWQLKPNMLNRLAGGPNPLLSTLAGGVIGSGLGYGTGALLEQILPERYFEKGKLRKTLGIGGALAGAVPGAWWGLDNLRAHPNENKRWTPGALVDPHPWMPEEIHQASYDEPKQYLVESLSSEALDLNTLWTKYADEAGSTFNPSIPVDQFNRTIWNDLRPSGGYTDPGLAAATTGLVQAASLSREGANLISPVDIARIGVGMGSGYLSGLVVGKTLGALAGLRPEAQETLQRTGMWAGMLGNIVPLIFR